jgi:serine/threonine protein kinase
LDSVLERDLSETFDEADTLTALNHAGIIKTLNRGFGDPRRKKRPYLVLEYFPGVTLDAWLRTNGTLPVTDLLVIARQAAEAVHAAHQVGIYHRDIKPANVMVSLDEKTRQWQVKVIDFGLAVKLHVARTSTSVLSGRRTAFDRSRAGTMRYTPPEQRNELDADVGPYFDVYAWGKTCLDLLFATTEPKTLHWKKLPDKYRDRVQALLERATLDDIENPDPDNCRFPTFEPVLTELAGLLGERRFPDSVAKPKIPLSEVIEEPPPTAPTPPIETPAQFLKRIKAEAAAKMEQARVFMGRYDYAAAVRILSDFTADQAKHRDEAMLRDATEKRDRLRELDRNIRKLLDARRFHDHRLPVWVDQYLKLKPDDVEMRELREELPPPNEPPANPKPKDIFTLRIPNPEPEIEPGGMITVRIPGPVYKHAPGEIMTVTIPPQDRGPKPGTPAAFCCLKWKPVPARPNPNK